MTNEASPSGEVSQTVERLFRHESGKMVATLTRIFGVEHLTLAEDVVQEALARALQTWPYYGVPQNPSAWIMRASRNLALDVVRTLIVGSKRMHRFYDEQVGANTSQPMND
jgi:predicted RNA polymerase sigma factor